MDSDRPADHFLRPDLIWTTPPGNVATLQNKPIQPIQRNSLLRCTLFVGCLFPFIVFGATTRCPLATVRIRRKCFQLFQFSLVTIISAHPKYRPRYAPHFSPSVPPGYPPGATCVVSSWRCVTLLNVSQNVGMFPRVEQWHFCDKDKSEKNMQELITMQGHNRRCSHDYGSHGPLA